MDDLWKYASELVEAGGFSMRAGEVFAKVLSPNDDSGRHGVLIPTDAYSFFPPIEIADPRQNETVLFEAFDAGTRTVRQLAYKYYQRYPERRITRVNGAINDLTLEARLVILLRATHTDGTIAYYIDVATTASGGRFDELFEILFGSNIERRPGSFVVRPVDSQQFEIDPILEELLGRFDEVKSRGWIDSLREGPTGIGYTFESLLGIKENNAQTADFQGIEIKCKGVREGSVSSAGKLNLFQAGPNWIIPGTAIERLRFLGTSGTNGLYSCYSQVTTSRNNLGLFLEVPTAGARVDLRKSETPVGDWELSLLEKRLAEKHSRAVFVKAEVRSAREHAKYFYTELVYCERPSIERFIGLLRQNRIVFEFTMSERPNGVVRNHGYPWRLTSAELLDQLFAFQVRLR